jgi:hypothetical protein
MTPKLFMLNVIKAEYVPKQMKRIIVLSIIISIFL